MKNQSTLFIYRSNAALFVDGVSTLIDWDGMTFETMEDYTDWIEDVLSPAKCSDNYDDIKTQLEIGTDYLRPLKYD